MQAVILAAGRGTRMKELTQDTPKPMLQVAGKNLIEHKILALPPEVDEVILVVGYLGNAIQQFFGNSYAGKKITYVEQSELRGTADAVCLAKGILRGNFLVMMGDDLYSAEDIKEALKYPWSLLVEKVETPKRGAQVSFDADGHVIEIIEAQELKVGMFNNAGLYVLGQEFFDVPMVQIPSGEYGLPQTLMQLAQKVPIHTIVARGWFQVTSPDDIAKAEAFLSKKSPDQVR